MRRDFGAWTLADAARHRAVVTFDAGGDGFLCAEAPPDAALIEAVETRLGIPLRTKLCDAAVVSGWLTDAEREGRALGEASATDASAPADDGAHELSLAALSRQVSPAVRLLDAVLHDALKDGASDVHVEMRADGADVRIRLDGVMLPLQRIAGRALAEQMVSRLKVMAELDIGERRLPQDGRFTLKAGGRPIDFRLSIMPSVHGEDAVVRVLDRRSVAGGTDRALTLESLGFAREHRDCILVQARAPHGMLLVTGPTGSGKTTTLYAAIGEIHQGREKIITIEDPVEYELPGVVQIPVNERKGLGFARGLRSILRHDPDRILVGEIRDPETAQIAVQAALTGHLVFSTVHANHVFDVIGRFAHMGLDIYNVVAALNAVLAQRLMRRVCEHCAETVSPGLRRAVGCAHCRGTGYRGRQAVAEVLVLDDALRDLIASRAPMQQIKQAARERGMRSLRQEALALVNAGLSTMDELERVVADE